MPPLDEDSFCEQSLRIALLVDPLTLANYLQHEHPQTIAVVLAHMDPRSSGPILELLPAEMQGDVAYRIAVLDSPNADTLRIVEEQVLARLTRMLS